jgi:hypothetical protein
MAFRNPKVLRKRKLVAKPCIDVSVVETSTGLHQTNVQIVQTDVSLISPLIFSPTQLQDDLVCGVPLKRVKSDVLTAGSDVAVEQCLSVLEVENESSSSAENADDTKKD